MPKVFLIAQPTVKRDGKMPDLTGLAAYGDVAVLLSGGETPSRCPAQTIENIAGRLTQFDPRKDFLAWAGGDTLAAVMLGHLMAELEIDFFTWLRWDRDREPGTGRRLETGQYYPVVVDFRPEDDHQQFGLDLEGPPTTNEAA